jgi:choline dehydrogenase-like flavoprotein
LHPQISYLWLNEGLGDSFALRVRILPCSYFRKKIPLQGVAHQCGTCRFGEDPQTSVLDINCRTHDVDNLYVVDGSFFRSSASVNPTLTIMANALRVGDHLIERT